jgi:hypothetical protein
MSLTRLSDRFPRYADFAPRVPVHCVTAELPGSIHRYYDSSPYSPSGRYLALTRLPFEDRLPIPAETAQVIVVDLETGEAKPVAETRGWDMQLGAQVQWGADDRSLLFNDVDVATWTPFGVRMNPLSGEQVRLDGTVYAVSPDGRWSAAPCLMRTAVTQRGYGVVVPRDRIPANRGASPSDGIFLTDTLSGASRLLVSIGRILEEATPAFAMGKYGKGDFYGFHVKWNPQGTRLMFVLRWLPRTWLPWKQKKRYRRLNVITMDADGGNARVAISDEQWRRGGNHPNWCPDGDHILMNLNTDGNGLRFVKVNRGRVRAPDDAPRRHSHPYRRLPARGRGLRRRHDAPALDQRGDVDGDRAGAHSHAPGSRNQDGGTASRSPSGVGQEFPACRFQRVSRWSTAGLRRRSHRFAGRKRRAAMIALRCAPVAATVTSANRRWE